MGPLKLTTALPISAPYSSCSLRMDSGDPSKPERLARSTIGRLLLAALMARATFLEERGKRVPALHCSGPSAGTKPSRETGFDSDNANRVAPEVGIPYYGCLRPLHSGPALKRQMILVNGGPHHLPNVKG